MSIGINEQYPAYRARIYRHNQERQIAEKMQKELRQLRDIARLSKALLLSDIPITPISTKLQQELDNYYAGDNP